MKSRPEKSTTTSTSRDVSEVVRRPALFLFGGLSPFERKVYKVVTRIPRGKICSYKDIAVKIGEPKAYRAVANALKANPFVGKVPCHRVIKSDGTIGGFSRGVEIKKRMLKAEGLTVKGDTVII